MPVAFSFWEREGGWRRARVFLCIPLYTLSHTHTHTHMANSVLFFAAAVFSCWWGGGIELIRRFFFLISRVAIYHHQYWAFGVQWLREVFFVMIWCCVVFGAGRVGRLPRRVLCPAVSIQVNPIRGMSVNLVIRIWAWPAMCGRDTHLMPGIFVLGPRLASVGLRLHLAAAACSVQPCSETDAASVSLHPLPSRYRHCVFGCHGSA